MARTGNNPGNNPDRNIKVKLSVEEREAVRSVRELERQLKKLTSVGSRGENVQHGFLSKKQVQLYKDILKEMEQAHSAYTARLDQANQEVSRRQTQYNAAQARGASQTHVNFYQRKLQHAQSQQQFLRNVVNQQQPHIQGAQVQSNRIGNLHQLNRGGQDLVNHATRIVRGTGAILGPMELGRYMLGGARIASSQEQNAWRIGQTMGYGGDYRDTIWDAQRGGDFSLGYNTNQTLRSQQHIMRGGTTAGTEGLRQDTISAQEFSRAYGMEGTYDIVQNSNTLKQMGAVSDGGQRRFADLLAGAIDKTKSRGREEELLRATTSLVGQIGSNMATVGDKSLTDTVSLQTMLGTAIPALKGERGASLLSNMDSAIKNGGEGLDVLLGKGIDPKYTGLNGMWNLAMKKEEGLTPENLQTIVGNAYKISGGREDVARWMLTDPSNGVGLSKHQYESLRETGVIDRMRSGKLPSADELSKLGIQSTQKGTQDFKDSWYGGQLESQAEAGKTASDVGLPALRVGQSIQSSFFGLPEPLQMGLMVGGAGLGGMLLRKLPGAVRGAYKAVMPNIAKSGGAPGLLRSAGSYLGNLFRGGGGGTPPTGGGFSSPLASAGGTFLKRLPMVGSLATVGLDRMDNPDHSWGESIAKGAGSLIGGAIGGVGAGLLGLGTGGAGLLASGAMVTGGSMLGSQAGDWLYNALNGSSATGDQKQLNVSSINIDDKNLASILDKKTTQDKGTVSNFSAVTGDSTTKGGTFEHNINIKISGDVNGMTPEAQSTIADSIGSSFRDFIGRNGLFGGGYDLSVDTKRSIG